MSKKSFSMLVFCVMMMQIITPSFNASGVEQGSEQQVEVKYAPVNPTPAQEKAAAPTDIVKFNNLAFEEYIASQLDVVAGEITVEDMSRLKKIDYNNSDVTDLSGLEYADNLTYITMYHHDIANIEPLAGLTKLEHISIAYNRRLTDISPVANLTNLTYVNFYQSNISDLTPLSGLNKLQSLGVSNNKITDFSAIAGLTTLKSLNLYGNKITDITPLAELTNLESINFDSNKIADVSPLVNLTKLKNLQMSFNNILDVTPLDELEENAKALDADFRFQTVKLPDRIVTTDDEIKYTFTSFGGEEIPVELGNPQVGVNEYTVKSSVLTSRQSKIEFSGTASQKVIYREVSGLDKEMTDEGTALTDEQLMTLFKITSDQGLAITVDQSKVNYDRPANYQITFTDGVDTHTATLTVVDLYAQITTKTNTITTLLGEVILDLYAAFEPKATEIFDGDLTDIIVMDSSSVDFNKVGKYNVELSTVDSDGNTSFLTVFVVVEAPILDGLSNGTINEKTVLTDEQLIELFTVSTNGNEIISVDQSAIDYNTPGEYPVAFSIASGAVVESTLTVENVMPTIDAQFDTFTLETSQEKPNLIEAYGVTATEFEAGDLNAEITIDDSEVDYSTAGNYVVKFKVVDSIGIEATVNVTMVIVDSALVEEDITIEETNTEVSINEDINSEIINDKQEVESTNTKTTDNSTNTSDNELVTKSKVMTADGESKLSNTGNKTITLIILLTAIIAVLFSLKTLNNRKN